jgi:F0F1-type ATP synthase assembly protein I
MMWKRSKLFVSSANQSLQENLDRGEGVIFAAYGIIGGILLPGGGGYLLDRWLNTGPWFPLVGLAIGLCLAFYGLVTAALRR